MLGMKDGAKADVAALGSMCEIDPDVEMVWVMSAKEHDGSGFHVLRSYAHKQRADEDMDLVSSQDTSRCYELTEVPVYRDANQ